MATVNSTIAPKIGHRFEINKPNKIKKPGKSEKITPCQFSLRKKVLKKPTTSQKIPITIPIMLASFPGHLLLSCTKSSCTIN